MENGDKKAITAHDKAVLTRIFNPNLPYGDTYEDDSDTSDEPVELETDELKEAKRLEVEGVKQAEAGQVDKALDLFNRAIQLAPSHAAAFNNRAQALRLQGDVQGALQDLNTAIEISGGKGQAACQAYTQRGLIKRLQEDDDGAKEDFQKAANLGGEFAKHLLIAMNPYAALCNQMLSDVMCRLRQGLPVE